MAAIRSRAKYRAYNLVEFTIIQTRVWYWYYDNDIRIHVGMYILGLGLVYLQNIWQVYGSWYQFHNTAPLFIKFILQSLSVHPEWGFVEGRRCGACWLTGGRNIQTSSASGVRGSMRQQVAETSPPSSEFSGSRKLLKAVLDSRYNLEFFPWCTESYFSFFIQF